MSTVAEVRLWGRTVGAAALEDGRPVAAFEYDRGFLGSGIELSPLRLPLSEIVYSFPDLSQRSFHGLPGLLADSLPDRFGNALIDAWLSIQGRSPDSFNAVERLCYTGNRGMGALEFLPASGPRANQASRIDIDRLVTLASEVLTERGKFQSSFEGDDSEQALRDILRVGTSAGGARAKAVIAWNPSTDEVRSGQVGAGEGFEHWLLKFDGVHGNRDRELEDPLDYGVIEYAYFLMARDAGIAINDCRLLEENGRRHFMTRRFDRLPDGRKLHMQSLAALAHFDYNLAGAYSYEQTFSVIRQLGLPMQTVEEQYRRMVFNVLARNQDDHVKNIAFLMDKNGDWSLSPSFDLTYSYNPDGPWTALHQMSLHGKRDNFEVSDLCACANTASMKRGRAVTILEEVQQAVARWQKHAEEAGVPAERSTQIERAHRNKLG